MNIITLVLSFPTKYYPFCQKKSQDFQEWQFWGFPRFSVSAIRRSVVKNMDPFFDIFKISMRNEKFWRKVGNTLYKFLDILKANFVTFLHQFLEKLVKNYPKNMKLFWENFKIIRRNYKIIILETFWKFLGKYISQVNFVKQIVNYLLKTLKKKFLRNFGLIT